MFSPNEMDTIYFWIHEERIKRRTDAGTSEATRAELDRIETRIQEERHSIYSDFDIRALNAETRELAKSHGSKMMAALDEVESMPYGELPDRATVIAFLVFLMEEAKHDVIHDDHDDNPRLDWRGWDAESARDISILLQQGAVEMARLAEMLRGPKPKI